MQEYWINVYPPDRYNSYEPNYFVIHDDKEFSLKHMHRTCVYRIHVKMKPVYVQKYGRDTRPKYDGSFAKDSVVLAKDFNLSTLIDDNSFKNRDLLRRAEDILGILDYH